MLSMHKRLLVVLNSEGRVMHQSFDPAHEPLLKSFVRESIKVGDNWVLLRYDLSEKVNVNDSLGN